MKPLTKRQREIVARFASGLQGRQICEDMNIGPKTLQTHVRNLKERIGAKTLCHAVAMALTTR